MDREDVINALLLIGFELITIPSRGIRMLRGDWQVDFADIGKYKLWHWGRGEFEGDDYDGKEILRKVLEVI